MSYNHDKGARKLDFALKADGIRVQVVEARASVRDRLRAEGLEEKVGGIDRLRTVAQVVGDFERQ